MKEFCEASPDQFVELRLDSGAVAIWMRKTTSLLCSPSRESDAIERPSGEIAVGKNRPELRRAGSGA
jgi:hypothetical protein